MRWWRFSADSDLEGLDRLIFEARQLRDHMVYLERSETAAALSTALAAFDGGAKPDGAGVKLRDALRDSYLEVSAQVDKHTLREVLKGNPPHARNAPILASIILAVIGVLHVIFAFHFTLWSSEGETLMANMRTHQEYDDLAHAMDLAELRAAIEGDLTAVVATDDPDAIPSPEQPHLIYYRGVYELSQHYREEVVLPSEIREHYSGLNPIKEAWDDWSRARCMRLDTQINLEKRRFDNETALMPVPALPGAAAPDDADTPNNRLSDAQDADQIGPDPELGDQIVARSDVPDLGIAAVAANAWRDPRDDADYQALFLRESEICPGNNRNRAIRLDRAADAAKATGTEASFASGPVQIGAAARIVTGPYRAVDGWLAYVNADAGRPGGMSGNNVRAPEAIRSLRDALSARLEVVHRWFLPAIYGGLGSVVYCLWRILSPDLSPLGVRYTVLRTSFAGLAAITLSMLLIPSQTLTLVAEPSRPFIYLLCFISGYSIEAFIAALSKLNEMLTSRLTPKEDPAKPV